MVINWNRTDSMSRFTTVTSIVLPKMRWSNLWRAQKPKVVWTEDEEIARIHSVLTLCISFWLFIMYEMRCVPNFQHYCYYYYLFIRLHWIGWHIKLNTNEFIRIAFGALSISYKLATENMIVLRFKWHFRRFVSFSRKLTKISQQETFISR